MIYCPKCIQEMKLIEIGYICDPPDKVAKLYFYECGRCGTKHIDEEDLL